MGDGSLSNAKYRRTPPASRPEPGRLPSGRRLVVVLVGLVLLAVLAVAITVLSEDGDGERAGRAATATTERAIGGDAPDVVVARQLLPVTLGPGWVEVTREDDPVPAEVDPDDPCAARAQPIPTGLVVRASFDHLATTILEQASIVAGVVTEGTEVPSLDDTAVIECLLEGLGPQVGDAGTLTVADQPLPPGPEGATLSGVRFDAVDGDGDIIRRFELLLLQRGRAVSFAIVVVADAAAATPLGDLVEGLDRPLAAGARRLG